jgi:hypothetical protein
VKRKSAFWRCLLPRLALGAFFTAVGFYGGGGDAEAYHVLGVHMRHVWEEGRTDFEDTINETGWNDPQPFADNYMALYFYATEPKLDPIFFNSITIIYIHGALYRIWLNPFMFAAFNSLVGAFALSRFIRAFRLERYERWLIYNPVSIFYAATHFKESLVESLVLMVAVYWFAERKYIRATLTWAAVCFFRMSYWPLIGLVVVGKYLRRIPGRLLLGGAMAMLVVLPPFYWVQPHGQVGRIFSVLYMNEWTRKTITPLFGMLQPMPFTIFSQIIPSVFFTVYGLFYLPMFFCALGWTLASRRNNVLITASLLVNLLIAYFAQAQPATKARYFAPFFPLMIAGVVSVWPEVSTQLRRTFGLNRVRRVTVSPNPAES